MNTKRTKTVFKSNELAHVWIRAGAETGRHKGKVAYLLDSAHFSSTTSQHKAHIRHALSSNDKTFSINSGQYGQSLRYSPAELRDWYLSDSKPADNAKSRYAHIRANEALRQAGAIDKAIEVCEFFGLATTRLVNLRCKLSGEADKALDVQQTYHAKLQLRREAREAKERERNIALAIALAEEIKSDQSKIANVSSYRFGYSDLNLLDSRPDLQEIVREAFAKQDELKIVAWRKGEYVNFDWHTPVMLRAVSDNMETSKGAIVPLSDAEKAYRFAMIKRSQGWERNGEQFKVGYYDLDRVNEQGVIAGCHRVNWNEIERFANEMNWLVA